MSLIFSSESANPKNPKWNNLVFRQSEIYKKTDDIRNDFARDYNRILHCSAYRRLKHKTQVFYATQNDHICTRIEHVHHVAAIGSTIAQELGLNIDLVSAISLGHDIGHAPFGHEGEKIISQIYNSKLGSKFWHEQNSLLVADKIETLVGFDGKRRNLNLTYAVRDGLISHCGEVDENGLKPRTEFIDLYDINYPNQYNPYTWEACVVKIADKIAYLGRDIEDALRLNMLNNFQLEELKQMLSDNYGTKIEKINTTNLVHRFIMDLVKNSDVSQGLRFSDEYFNLMKIIKDYNYSHIYKHHRLRHYNNYAKLIINSLFEELYKCFTDDGVNFDEMESFYPEIASNFKKWLVKYTDYDTTLKQELGYEIPITFSVKNEADAVKSILIFISLMSDQYLLKQFGYLIEF